jgi:hypothetical protein
MSVIDLLKRIAVIAAFGLGSQGAQAALYSWGAHAPLEAGAGFPVAGNFVDYWTFTVSEPLVRESSVVVANNNPPAFNINPSTSFYFLYNAGADGMVGGSDDILLGSWGFDGTTGATHHAVDLTAGNYFFSVIGTASGALGGVYAISSDLSPVPAPESFGLLAAGLGLLGMMAWRRREAGSGVPHAMA